MSLTVKIWNAASEFVTVQPDWTFKNDTDKISELNRTPAGKATLYTYGTFKVFTLPLRFVPYSDAGWINEIYDGSRMCQIELIQDGISAVYSVVFLNTKSPFYQLEKPLNVHWQGEVKLSEY